MLKIIFSLGMAAILAIIIKDTWLHRSQTIPVDKDDFLLEIPRPSDYEIQLAQLGKKLFQDKRFSSNQQISCESCHIEAFGFADHKPLSQGIGLTAVNTPTIINSRWQKWFFWDGRADNLVSQAMGPITNVDEHNFTAEQVIKLVESEYKEEFEQLFGMVSPREPDPGYPHQTFINFATAIAQYVKGIVAMDSPFDRFLRQYNPEDMTFVDGFGEEEWHGFQVFLGKAGCADCHNGPLLSDQKFYFTGLANANLASRKEGLIALKQDPLRCHEDCPATEETTAPMAGAVKTPTLRNLNQTAPYFHDGSAGTIRDVIYRYMRPSFPEGAHGSITNLFLNATEVNNLERFLNSLTSPIIDIHDPKHRTVAKTPTSKEKMIPKAY